MCGPTQACGHDTPLVGDAYCVACAEALNVCIECGISFDKKDVGPSDLVAAAE